MNVRELIEKLSELTPEQQEKRVQVEGCDCYGDAGDVEVWPGEVIITRERP